MPVQLLLRQSYSISVSIRHSVCSFCTNFKNSILSSIISLWAPLTFFDLLYSKYGTIQSITNLLCSSEQAAVDCSSLELCALLGWGHDVLCLMQQDQGFFGLQNAYCLNIKQTNTHKLHLRLKTDTISLVNFA